MPLLQRQTSKKNKQGNQGSVDISESATIEEDMSIIAEVNSVLNKLIDTVSKEADFTKENSGTVTEDLPINTSSLEPGKGAPTNKTDDSSENVIVPKKITKKVTRSSSECGSGIESQTKVMRRRFASEAEVHSILPPQKTKELDEAIVHYIDKLIKNSVYEAVRNINVDNLHKEPSNFTNSQNCQSTETEDFTVEQRLKSDSVLELVELGSASDTSKEISNLNNDTSFSNCDNKANEYESVENEVDDIDRVSFGGYLADVDDTTSIDDLKSADEDSLYSSSCSALESNITSYNNGLEISGNGNENESVSNINNSEEKVTVTNETTDHSLEVGKQLEEELDSELKSDDSKQEKGESVVDNENTFELQNEQIISTPEQKVSSQLTNISGSQENLESKDKSHEEVKTISLEKSLDDKELKLQSEETLAIKDQIHSVSNTITSVKEVSSATEKSKEPLTETNNLEEQSLIALSPEDESALPKNILKAEENKITSLDVDEGLPQPNVSEEERMKINWKVGTLHVKLPHKTRGKAHLKAWKKRRVIIQPDEFVNDPKNQSLVISVYGSDSKKHAFWHSVSSQKATVFRSSSRSHRYAFTISEGGQALIHLAAETETATQEWMAAVRAVLWPPSPFMELEKMLSGQEFEVSIIDNEFTYHAGLLGMYGYLSITPKKLTLLHPQQGYVIQEWYLNTVDKFQFVPQAKEEDLHKVLCMTTCSDSSTGQGNITFFCAEAVTLLQSLASNIHQVLSYHSKQEGGKYQKELEEIAEWLVVPPQDCLKVECDEHYKVPPRQVKSLLDIPNFIFNKSLSPVASAIYLAPNTEIIEPLDAFKNKPTNISQDSGISTCTSGDDFLNSSVASFIIGGGSLTGKSSDSELSDTYTPPRTPEIKKKIQCEVVKEEQISAPET